MPVTVKVNGSSNSLVHKGSTGVSTATIPDVCKTPSPGGPVPIPYPNISQSTTLAKGTKTVKADGGNTSRQQGLGIQHEQRRRAWRHGRCQVEHVYQGVDVDSLFIRRQARGQERVPPERQKFHNHQNTVNLAGEIQQVLGLSDADFKDYCKKCKATAATEKQHAAKMRDTYKDAPGRTPKEIEDNLGITYYNKFGELPAGDANIPRASTGFDTPPKVDPQPGPCGELKTVALQVHVGFSLGGSKCPRRKSGRNKRPGRLEQWAEVSQRYGSKSL